MKQNKKSGRSSSKHKKRSILEEYTRIPAPIERPEPTREEKQIILIYCEGKNTEPSYFNKFRLSNATIKALGEGYNSEALVRKAIQYRDTGEYDQVWCVFDRDDNPPEDFNNAVWLIEKERSKTISGKEIIMDAAYSIQAFEYWLILHFNDHQRGPMHRDQYHQHINSYINPLGAFYDGHGDKKVSDDFFKLLDGKDQTTGELRRILAMKRAERNHNKYDHRSPATEESTTTVYKLMRELKRYF